MKQTVNLSNVGKASIKRELEFYPKDIKEIEDGVFEVVGPKGIHIKLEATSEEDEYNVINLAVEDEDEIEDIDLDLDIDDDEDMDGWEEEKPVKKKAPKKSKKEEKKKVTSDKKETRVGPGNAPVKTKKVTTGFKDDIINKVANGSIVNSKKIVVENIKLEELAPTIELIKSTKLTVEVEYKNNNLTLVGDQAGLAAVYLLLNENK